MKAWKKLVTALAVATLTGTVLAAAGNAPTRESIEKSALATHPGKVETMKHEKKSGKSVWEVKVKGDDGKEYVMYFDAKTGKEVKS